MGRSDLPYADLHVHSTWSDSSLTPAEIVAEALRAGVGLLAVADHELVEGSLEAAPLARAAGIDFIGACEMECTWGGRFLHILAYGADTDDAPFRELAARGRKALDDMSVDLIGRMRADYPALSLEEFEAYRFDKSGGGWKGLGYLLAKGVTKTLREGLPLYERYGVLYEDADFPPLAELLRAQKGAGAKCVLAHPGVSFRDLLPDEGAICREAEALLDAGIDGIECFYPAHSPALREGLLRLARARGALITAGSDCHGVFGRTRLGEMNVERGALRLAGLL